METAVDWLIKELNKKQNGEGSDLSYDKIYDQAKEMEKQQIIFAFQNGQYNAHPDSCCKLINGETYYNQEFTL